MEYVYFDVDKIKEFVFDSFKPTEVAGASELVKAFDFDRNSRDKGELLKRLEKEYDDLKPVYARGGSGLLTVDNSKGKEVCEWLEREYHHYSRHGKLTAVCHPEEDFPTDLSALDFKLRQRKSDKWITKELDCIDFDKSKKCKSCSKRPSKGNTEPINNEQVPYCSFCSFKRKEGNEVLKKGKASSANSLEDIAKKNDNDPNQNLLVIYGDLNEAGAKRAALQNVGELQKFSDNIFEALEDARREIRKELTQSGYKWLMPIVGGDDIVIFTHPETFESVKDHLFKIEQKLTHDLKMNFSFLVARHTFPIYHLFRLAEDLLQKTKDRYYREGKSTTYHGFYWLWENSLPPDDSDVYLDSEFESLLKMAKIIHSESSIPNSTLYRMLDLISMEPQDAEKETDMEYFYVRQRELQDLIYLEYLDFGIRKGGIDIKLTKDILDDLIRLRELLPSPGNAKEVPNDR